jgi:S-DNA-T family DNA segregation ATPase FtsK/SpoIIIE
MKVCPTCKKTYKDEDLNFCLSDGATLLKKRGAASGQHSRVNEVVAIALLAFAVLTFLCLISYDPGDPTFNSASAQKVRNWIGVVGANYAEFLVSMIGVVAYLFPALLGLIAWRVFNSENLKPTWSRVAGYLMFIASTAALAHLAGWHGGILGAFIETYTEMLFSPVGTAIVLTATLLASIILITDLTFLGFYGSFEMAWANFKIHYGGWKAKRRAARADQIESAKGRLEKRRQTLTEKSLAETPTISKGEESVATVQRGKTRAAAAGMTQPELPIETTPTIAAEETVPDTVFSDESVATNGDVPISPVKHTGDLPETEAPAIEAPEEPGLSLRSDQQNFENYVLPGTELLTEPAARIVLKDDELRKIAASLAEKTSEFNVAGKVVNICPGPVVTTYEFKPDPGVKYSRVTSLVDDLCLALKAESIRIDRIPGKAYVGIEGAEP